MEKASAPRRDPVDASRAEARRVLRGLRDRIEDSDLLQRDVEDALGWTRGYLSQILNGHVELRVTHLERVLGVLEVAPARFFRELYAPPPRRGRGSPKLKVNRDVVRIYSFGIEAAGMLRRRIESCEEALRAIARSRRVERRIKGRW